MLLSFVITFLLGVSAFASAQNETARKLFADKKSAIVQVRIIDLTSGSKSTIGSGFLVDDQGLIATNYHVVQLAVSKPEQYRIEYLSYTNETGDLELVDVDAINDLALVKAKDFGKQPLVLATQEPDVGVSVYALGNPLDLGLTVVPGTYNGINKAHYYPRVHFTGSLNPGMSGGPTLDEQGRIVGINVSTAGNQISFLVPVERLHRLVEEYKTRISPITDFKQRIGVQLLEDQQKKFSLMLAQDWQSIALGEARVLAELTPFVKCWGGSNASSTEAQFLSAERSCRSEDSIFLSSQFSSGVTEYQFFWLEADKLNSWQFYSYYQSLFSEFVAGNRGGKNDVSDFACDNNFVDGSDAGRKTKAVICVRAYKEYPQLYDMLFLQGTVDDGERAFISHFTLAGVSRENGLAFSRKFMEVSQWQ